MIGRRLVVLGGPGDGLSVAEAVHSAAAAGQQVSLFGFLNDALPKGEYLQRVPILGKLEDWRYLDEDIQFLPAIQKVGDMPARVRRIRSLEIPEHRWGTLIHPTAVVSPDVEIGPGSFILSCATVQPLSRIGKFSGVRAGAMLGHHSIVGDHAYVGPNATLCGHSELREAAHLGPGAVLLDSKIMDRFSIAGISAAVTKDVSEFCIVFGNPARRVGWVKRPVPLVDTK